MKNQHGHRVCRCWRWVERKVYCVGNTDFFGDKTTLISCGITSCGNNKVNNTFCTLEFIAGPKNTAIETVTPFVTPTGAEGRRLRLPQPINSRC